MTFQVMSNPEFVNTRGAQKPSFTKKEEAEPDFDDEERSEAPSPVAESEVLDSISVVEEKKAKASAFRPVLPPTAEIDEDVLESEEEKESDELLPETKQESVYTRVSVKPESTRLREASPLPLESVHSDQESVVSSVSQASFKSEKAPAATPIAVPKSGTSEEVKRRAREMAAADVMAEKEGLLTEISLLQKQGVITLYRELSIKDSLEEIQFQ
jgi:hypothetical protein